MAKNKERVKKVYIHSHVSTYIKFQSVYTKWKNFQIKFNEKAGREIDQEEFLNEMLDDIEEKLIDLRIEGDYQEYIEDEDE